MNRMPSATNGAERAPIVAAPPDCGGREELEMSVAAVSRSRNLGSGHRSRYEGKPNVDGR